MQIKSDKKAAGLTKDDPPDFVFIDDFGAELQKTPWLDGELTNCRNQGIYVGILAQNMDSQTVKLCESVYSCAGLYVAV